MVRMASELVELPEENLLELERYDDIQLSTSGRGRTDSKMGKNLFCQKHKECLAAAEQKARVRIATKVLDVLENSVFNNLKRE